MGAHVEHKFDKDFLLDEERLRKIKGIIEERINALGLTEKPVYKVFRGDSFYYETQTIDDVIAEDNEDWRKITRLEIQFQKNDALQFLISFSGQGSTLTMEGTNRDDVFLLYSDLKTYVENEVATHGIPSRRLDRLMIFFPFVFIAAIVIAYFLFSDKPPEEVTKAALESQELSDKLDYMIEYKTVDRTSLAFGVGFLSVLVFMFVILGASKIIEFCRPTNEFLFGKRKDAYESRKALGARLFWGVIVALVVSVFAGFIVWLSTRS